MYELIFWTCEKEHPGNAALTIVSKLLNVDLSAASNKLSLGVVFGGVSLFQGDQRVVEDMERRAGEMLLAAKMRGDVPKSFRFSVLDRAMPN